MTTYVALLRGINVGGRNKVAMADLRRVVEQVGGRDVATYVNSGNVVLESDDSDGDALARRVEKALESELGVGVRVLVLSARELAEAAGANPYADEPDPKKVHLAILPEPADAAARRSAQQAQEQAAAKGSRDRIELRGKVAYLHTPDGFGRSVLAELLNRKASPTTAATSRNWSTVTRLRAMCDERQG